MRPSQRFLWFLLGGLSLIAMVHYVTVIWSHDQPAHFSDLYAPWWAAHELFLHGRNPYSPAVAHEIQTVIYGSPTTPSGDDPSGIAGGFAYPPYATLLLWPTIYFSFAATQKLFLYASALLILLSVALWLRASSYRPPAPLYFALALFVLGSFPALEAMKLQNLSLVAAAFLAAGIFFACSNRLALSGFLFALATFKPQFTIALLPWLALWTIADWRRRKALVFSFLATMAALLAFSQWLVPGWIAAFLSVVRAYRHYTFGHSLLDLWFTVRFGLIASALLLLGAWAWCWRQRAAAADSPQFFVTTSMLLALDVVIIPTLAPHAQLLLIPGILCLLLSASDPAPLARTLRAVCWLLLAWPWTATALLLVARLWTTETSLLRYWQLPLYTSPLIPLAVAVALCPLLLNTENSASSAHG